jgi:hypothetical protein
MARKQRKFWGIPYYSDEESIEIHEAGHPESEQIKSDRMARNITACSFILWVLSLALPGFTLDGNPSKEVYGVQILIQGVLLGWMTGVFAAYANVFYLYAAVSLTKNETPVKSIVLMVCLAATTVFVRSILADEGGGRALITSWGWGAILWGISLLLLVVAVLTQTWRLSNRSVAWMIGAIGVMLLSIFWLNRYQWSSANVQDRTAYLASSMAFSATKLCDVPVTLVAKSLVPAEDRVSVDSSMDVFLKNYTQWSGPALSHFEKNGYEWVYRNRAPDLEIGRKVAADAKPPRFLLRAAPHESGYQIQLVDKSSEQIVYEQRIVDGSFRGANHCPSAHGNLGYLQTIRKAVSQDQAAAYFAGPRQTEEGRTLCSAEYQMPYVEGRREPVKYCSEHYIAIWFPVKNPKDTIYLSALILDKTSLALVDRFSSYMKCPSEDCLTASTKEITGFRVDESRFYVLTTGGELVANREPRIQ